MIGGIYSSILSAFEEDLKHGGISTPLLKAYLALLSTLARCGGAAAATVLARTACKVLMVYCVGQLAPIKALLQLVLSCTRPLAAAAIAAAEVCESALSDGSCDSTWLAQCIKRVQTD